MHRIQVIDNFMDEKDIDIIVNELEHPSERLPYPDYYAKRNGGTAFPYNPVMVSMFKKYGNMANEKQKELMGYHDPIYVTKIFGSVWTKGTKGDPHIDAQELEKFIEWSCVIYLNEPPEFEGGTIFFPHQKFEYVPKKGSAIFFPSAGTEYLHGITEVTAGLRKTFCIMQSSIKAFADPDILIK